MKKLLSYFLVAMLLPALVLTGCKDDTDDPTPAETGNFTTLSTYMVNQNLDLPTLLDGWVIDPILIADGGIVDPTDYSIPDWVVFDIRSAADFALGHIKGSVNVALANIVTEAQAINNNDAKILVVCYTGQTAGRAVMALRLSGFPNAKVSKFGFSAWSDNAVFDKWSGNVSDQAVGNANWVTTASPALPVNGFPTWTTTSTDGATILNEKINEMLANTAWSVSGTDVLANPADFSIYNFWSAAEYAKYGHFAGAYQFLPISLAGDIVTALNADNNLIYCYTGQTSSFTVAWLQVLGYDAKSILYGVNGLSYTALVEGEAAHWHFPYHSYGYEVSK